VSCFLAALATIFALCVVPATAKKRGGTCDE
jgi:hypothetical protein